MLFRDASETGSKITADTGEVAKSLRQKDGQYQAALEMLLVSDKGSRAQYLRTKEALITKMANARRDCRKQYTVKVEQRDPAYMRSFAQLLAHRSTATLKTKLRADLLH